MAEVIIFGASQWAELAHFYLTHDSPHEVAGFTVDRGHLTAGEFKGLPVVAFEEVDRHYPPDRYRMFIPISFKKMNHVRAEKYDSAKQRGYELITITSHVVISGCCTIEEYCFFGVNSTVRDEAVVAHDTLVGMGVAIVKDTKPFEVYRTPTVEPERVRSDQLRSLSYKSKG
jgi:hypothetical protein